MKEKMANLSALLQDLGDRIASKDDGSTQLDDDDPLVARFRSLLPNLLEGYFVPVRVKVRESSAILKLLCHTVTHYPAVFFHGKGHAVLPIMGRIIPLLSEPAMSNSRGVLFETLCALASILHDGDKRVYRGFFSGAVVLVQDMVSVGSFFSSSSACTFSASLSVQCYSDVFEMVYGSEGGAGDTPLCQLHAQWKPQQGYGLLVDVTGDERWLPLAEWTLKLVSHCLAEGGALLVEGLLCTSFLEAVGMLLCYGSGSLHEAAFQVIQMAASLVDADVIPREKLIMSLLCVLAESGTGLLPFRNNVYDSALASCLLALYSASHVETIECTAQTFVQVFPTAMWSTTCRELRVALCDVFGVILKHCPSYVEHVTSFLELSFKYDTHATFSHSIQLAIEILGIEVVSGFAKEEDVNKAMHNGIENRMNIDVENTPMNAKQLSREEQVVSDSRQADQEHQQRPPKRQKLLNARDTYEQMGAPKLSSWPHVNVGGHYLDIITTRNEEKTPAQDLHAKLLHMIDSVQPPGTSPDMLSVDDRLAALSTLARVFSHFPGTLLCNNRLQQQLQKWIPWLQSKGQEGSLTRLQLSLFLEAMEKFAVQGSRDKADSLSKAFSSNEAAVLNVLSLPWSQPQMSQTESPHRMKCRALSIAVTVAIQGNAFDIGRILKSALTDDDVSVRSAAVRAVPVLTACYRPERALDLCEQLIALRLDSADQVRKAVAESMGLLVCAYHASLLRSKTEGSDNCSKSNWTEFTCPLCDTGEHLSARNGSEADGRRELGEDMIVEGEACLFTMVVWRSLFAQLQFGETSQHVQVAFIESMPRFLQHITCREVDMTRVEWLKCLDVVPLHGERAVREAFSLQIRCFVEDKILQGLFDNASSGELELLGKLKQALHVSHHPDVIETLMETVAEVAQAARYRRQLLFFSLVLLIECVDSANMSIQVSSIRLLHKVAAAGWPGSKRAAVRSMVDSVQQELFDYLCKRLITRPRMIEEVSHSVMGMETAEFLKHMIPVVLPKLILDQQLNPQVLDTLLELAKLLDTELPYLLVEHCHQVLSFLLLRADGNELWAALQFYEAQTNSGSRDIFVAVLPALLDELVRLLGDADDGDASKRCARVGKMIKEVAQIVTGSDDLPSFLRTHFVGLLNSIDRKMLRAGDLGSQKQALRCIEQLMDMIGQHLSAFVPKMMALLTRALAEGGLQSEGLRVWLSFVQTLARVAPANLKNIGSQIVVALMPCLEAQLQLEDETGSSNVSAVVGVLEELIVKNDKVLEGQVLELPLLPTHSKLSNVNRVLREARGLLSVQDRDELQRAADGLSHESLSVRYMTARELNKWMRMKRKEMSDMVTGESSVDANIMSNLVTALLRGCGEESRTSMSQRLKMACAQCLGELGAIDPVKLHVHLRQPSKIDRSDQDLVFDLINEHLAKVFRAAGEVDVQDAAALAIQELFKFSGCTADLLGGHSSAMPPPQSSTDGGEQLWRRFSEDVKEIITPCLTSKYSLHHFGAAEPTGPIFQPTLSFRRWIYLWIRRLVSQATGRRAEIFAACRGVVRHDMGTALYLLPYLVLNVICHGSPEARDGVTKEIVAVLEVTPAFSDAASADIPRSWSGPSEMSTQAVFTLLDNLGQWLDDSKLSNSSTQQAGKSSTVLQQKHLSELLEAIPKQALARASFRCQAYARALLYFESHVRSSSGALNPAAEVNGSFKDEDVSLLLEMHSGLDEPDGLSGLSRLRKSVSLQDQILINEKAGNWAEALACCEQALQLEPTSVTRQLGVLDCLLNMGHFQALVTHVDGLIFRLPEKKKEWSLRGVQAAWRLGSWDLLDEYVKGASDDGSATDSNAAFDISLAKILQALQKGDQAKFQEQLMQCRQSLLAPLAAASMESYTRAYPLIVKLHMLKELEDFNLLTSKDDGGSELTVLNVVEQWEDRLQLTQPSLWTREPILALRRLVFRSIDMQSEVGTCWLQYAKLCRIAGHYETASRAILEAKSAGAVNVHMEMAKLLWDTHKSHRAIVELQQAIPSVHGQDSKSHHGGKVNLDVRDDVESSGTGVGASSHLRRDDDRDAAKALLLLARWVHHTGQNNKEDVLNLFSRVRELQPRWEKAYFYVAKYYDDLLVDARRRQEEGQDTNVNIVGAVNQRRKAVVADDQLWWTYLPDAILFYAKSLHRGHRRLFQALPRLLTLWFEFGSTYCEKSSSSVKAIRPILVKVMNVIRGCLKELPSYQWLTALSQLVSRICHPNEDVVKLVKLIITTVVRAYPQQALWTMAAVSKSTVKARRDAATEVLRQASTGESEKLLLSQFTVLIEQMIKLCFLDAKAKHLSIASDFGVLKRMMPVRVIVPIQRALTVALPADGLTNPDFNPFSVSDNSTIFAIKDEVEVLASLQRPKKVVLLSSDGVEHPFLCKPKDDLRKDARMMEFTTMINRLLSKDPKSRRRKLYIRTFAVIPLTEESGMIEWVLHTRGLRHILQDLYVASGHFDRKNTNPYIKRMYDQHQGQKPGGEMLRTKILPMFPPIFHRWFLNSFPEPGAWFRARIAYAHTSAVWSMVGHILGLGDRHGENILFDSTTGDCVHVDFSCLFDKGLTLDKPELVPFRLTQNIVDGLGITGYEGTFIRVCEITLSILRAHRETLMSVLETFIHDPLVEWTKTHKSSGVEVQNPHAKRAIANIEARLQGVVVGVGAAPSLPLSVEGQAHRLITEAVSHENLEKMYIWWMAWF